MLRNTSFTKRCFGEADLLSTLVGSIDGAEHLTQMKVRDSWRQLVRERERDRARGTLALAVRSFKTRAQCKAFFSDVRTIEKGSEVLVGKKDERGRIRFRRHSEPGTGPKARTGIVTGVSRSAGSKVSYKVKMRGSEEERNPEPRCVRHIDTIQLTDHFRRRMPAYAASKMPNFHHPLPLPISRRQPQRQPEQRSRGRSTATTVTRKCLLRSTMQSPFSLAKIPYW